MTSGGTPSRRNLEFYKDGTIPWVKSGELENNVITETDEYITEAGLDNSSAKIFPKGTLLIALYGATIGKLAFLGIDAATNQAVCGIFKNDKVDLKYLYYFLLFSRPNLVKQGQGGAQPNISQTILKKLIVPYPMDKGEQQRIVARIEELFSQLDDAEATLQKTKAQLALYRQGVLKEAFSFSSSKVPIRDVSSIVTSGSRGWAQYYSDKGARFIRITDLTRNGIELKNDDIQRVYLPDNVEGKRSRLQTNDVLVSITADLGSIAIIQEYIDEAYINQHIAMIRFMNPKQGLFMAWYLKSEYGQKDLLKNKRGNGKMGLGLDDIRDTLVPVVDDEYAKKVVDAIDSRLSICDFIEKKIEKALSECQTLRRVILQSCFIWEE